MGSINKYYTPSMEEFVQGFEFEYYDNTSYRMVMLDFVNHTLENVTPSIEVGWKKMKVWWKYKPNERVKEVYDGIEYSASGSFINFWKPFDDERIKELIDEGRIRVKIN